MELTRHDQELLAELVNHAGYRRLLDLMRVHEHSILDEVESEADPAKVLRNMRFWQFLRKVNGWLNAAPATVADELTRLRESGQLDLDVPYSRDHAWNMRYGRHEMEPEEEVFDPASI